jgi:hypothetical protein
MGDWSDYFEDFPEENPANYVGHKYDPQGAAASRAAKSKLDREQTALNAEIKGIIEKYSKPKK